MCVVALIPGLVWSDNLFIAFASVVILGFEPRGTHGNIFLSRVSWLMSPYLCQPLYHFRLRAENLKFQI
jgi:hypothetical protein